VVLINLQNTKSGRKVEEQKTKSVGKEALEVPLVNAIMGSWSSAGLVVVASAHNNTSFNFELALPFGQSDLFPDLAVSQSKTDAALSNLSSTLLVLTEATTTDLAMWREDRRIGLGSNSPDCERGD
jgi:hypothetical protein